jgi:hypothetical protein
MDENEQPPENTKIEEEYLRWTSPSRLFKKRDADYYKNVGAIVFLLVVIMLFAREYMLVVAVLSIVFFIYVTSTVPPENVEHRITNLGIESVGQFYRWEQLAEFWFDERWGQEMIEIQPIFGTRIVILLDKSIKNEIRDAVAKYIPYREHPQKTFVDNAATWISEKIPLEKPS